MNIHPNVLKNITLCLADKGDEIIKKIRIGTIDDCSTMYLWTLIFINYLLPREGLSCLPDCSGEISGKKSNKLNNFINFANKHCDACGHGSDRHVFTD